MPRIPFRAACLALGLVIALATSAQADDKVRVDIPDDFKTCQRDQDCMPIVTSCDGPTRCCEHDAMNNLREKDFNAMKSKQCVSTAIRPLACTMCEPDNSRRAACVKNTCVYSQDSHLTR